MESTPIYFSSIMESTPVDSSTADVSYAEYRTSDLSINSGGNQTTNYYEIQVKDSNQWLHMAQSYIQVRAKITDANGADIVDVGAPPATTGEVITMAAAGAHAFSRLELLANDSQIDICENPGMVQLVNALLSYNKDKIASVAESEWLQLDDPQIVLAQKEGSVAVASLRSAGFAGADADVYDKQIGNAGLRQFVAHTTGANGVGAVNPLHNRGFMLRWLRTRLSREFEFIIPMSAVFGFCRDIRACHRGVKWSLLLQKNIRYPSYLHGGNASDADASAIPAATAGAQLLLTKVSLWVPQITPSMETVEMLEATLASGETSKQYFENMTCRFSEDYAVGTREVEYLLPLESKTPVKMIFGLQRQSQYVNQNDNQGALQWLAGTGTFNNTYSNHANPSAFSFVDDITELELRINNKSLPREKYKLSFSDTKSEYARAYQDLLKLSGKFASEEGSVISYSNYKSLYPLFGFDLRDYTDVFSGVRNSDIRFRCRVGAGGAGSTTAFRVVVIIYSERTLIVQPIGQKVSLKV